MSFPAFDKLQFDKVLGNHPALRSVRYRRQAEEGDHGHADPENFVIENADWENVKATLKEFHVLLRNLDDLNRGLLSLINASLPLGFAAPLAYEASQLRVYLTDLYFFLYTYVEKMQDAWFDHEDFDQFTKDPSANLVLHRSSDDARHGRFASFAGHVETVSHALQRLDELAASVFENAEPVPVLQPLFRRVSVLRNIDMKEPKFYPRDYPLATIIKACNGWMPGMIAVLNQWAGIEIPSLIKVQSRHTEVLQNISTVAALFSGASATTLQYSAQLGPSNFATPYNFLWLLSLLLSTASAMQCQLAIYWHTSRGRRTPKDTFWIVRAGATAFPRGLLGASFVTFLIGLVHFTFKASSKHSYVAIGITAATCLIGLAVFAFMLFVIHERKLSPLRT